MINLDPDSLKFWQSFSEWGFWLVIVGVFGESVDLVAKWLVRCRKKRLPKRVDRWMLPLESFFWIILCVGLAMEFLGGHKAMLIAGQQNAILTNKAEQAGKDAADARLEVARITQTNLSLVNSIEQLRSTNLWWQAKLQPRTITPMQVTNFIFLTEKILKIPIKVCTKMESDENRNYTIQFRKMLNAAGYENTNANNIMGIDTDPTMIMWFNAGVESEWGDVFFVTYGTNNVTQEKVVTESAIVQNNIVYTRPIVSTNDPIAIGIAIEHVLIDMGIKVHWMPSTAWVKPGQIEFVIPEKLY
jgi:hypothetical protein